VLHAGGFEHRAHTAAGDQAGAGRGGLEEDLAAVGHAEHVMGNRVALELHVDHVLVGVGGALPDRLGNFVGLAVADADLALAVADNGERGEAEAAAALHDLGAAVDEDDLLDHLRAVGGSGLVAVVATLTVTTRAAGTAVLSTAIELTGLARRS